MSDSVSWHGTVTGYANHRCRCDPCRSAYNAWHRHYLKHGPKPKPVVVPGTEPWHGTASGYRTHGCRCDPCRQAAAADTRRLRRQRTPRTFTGDEAWHGKPYGYTYHRCRCDACRAANAAWMRRYRHERRTGDASLAYEVLILHKGDPLYERVIGRLRADTELLDLMWQAAESRLDEHPDKVWVVAVGPNYRALAWCAYQPQSEGGIKCTNNFERPQCWDDDLYGIVYQARHELIRHHNAVTYVYDEPLDLHLWDGWVQTADGWSSEPDAPSHHWHELRRPADPAAHERG